MPGQPSKLKNVKDISRKDILFCVARVPESKRVFAGSSDFKIYEFDFAQAKPDIGEFAGHGSYVTGVALAGDSLISCSYDCKLIWWDLAKRTPIRTIENAHTKWMRAIVASPDGSLLATVGDDMVCRLWDAKSGEKKHELRGHQEKTPTHFTSMLYTCCFSPDSKLLATADRVGHIVIWDVSAGKQKAAVEAPGLYTWDDVQRIRSIGGVRSLAFSADSKLLAAGGVGKIGNVDGLDGRARVEVFDWEKGQRTHEMQGPNGMVNALAFHPQGDWLLAAAGIADAVLFFDLKTKKVMHEHKAKLFIHAVALDETMETIFAVGHNKLAMMEMKI